MSEPDQRARVAEAAADQHHHGHRDRLRARFRDGGPSALADYELLELVLFRAIPRKDVKPLAKRLIAQLGGFAEVIAAPMARLVAIDGVSERTALELKIVQAAAERAAREQVLDRPVISSWTALLDYCRTVMAREGVEQFRVLFLDKKNRLIADELMGRGTVDQAPVYVREVLHRALHVGATAMILAHNHPSGDPTPSQADIDMTRAIIDAAHPLGVTVHDHIVIARERVASFKQLGLL